MRSDKITHFPPCTEPGHSAISAIIAPLLMIALILGLGLECKAPAFAANSSGSNASVLNASEKIPSWINPEPFEYTARNKPNPFEPFIRRSPGTEEGNTSKNKTLTPLERISPSQLKLEGILNHGAGAAEMSALVELPNGKGYILRKGMRIGTEGARVESIQENSIIIQQQYIDRMGEKKTKQTVLKLPQEAGEKNE
ncbi:MAG: pilus assembly protein PilP [Desulfohalobiaceae bacterium]|nr:pilus assembly protein PilP [Desulfohalobiaceae bacterium]